MINTRRDGGSGPSPHPGEPLSGEGQDRFDRGHAGLDDPSAEVAHVATGRVGALLDQVAEPFDFKDHGGVEVPSVLWRAHALMIHGYRRDGYR